MTTLLTPTASRDTHPVMLAWFQRRGFGRDARGECEGESRLTVNAPED